MVLESTVLCLDNSEYMRNGDYTPTRLQTQQDAANYLIQCKIRSNPESHVALLTMAPRPNVLVGLTHDNSRLMAKLHQVKFQISSCFIDGMEVAQLMLKHRPNRTSQSRIIVFIGSPVEESEEELIRLAKQFKKARYFVDIILYGEIEANQAKLESFIATLNGTTENNSHMIVVPPGSTLTEALRQSSIVQTGGGGAGGGLAGDDGAAGAGGVVPGGEFDFGVDAAEDPELALALRVSLEEERQRLQQQAAQQQGGSGTATAGAASSAAAAATGSTSAIITGVSSATATTVGATTQQQPISSVTQQSAAPAPNLEAMTEEEQIEYALRISMAQESSPSKSAPQPEPMEVVGEGASKDSRSEKPSTSTTAHPKQQDNIDTIMTDPKALEALVSTLPGVDPKSEAFRKAKEEKEKKAKKDAKESKNNETSKQ